MGYDLGSGHRHNSPEETMYASCQCAQSLSAAPYGVHIQRAGHGLHGHQYTWYYTPAHTLSEAPCICRNKAESVQIRALHSGPPLKQLGFRGKKLHIRTTRFHCG